MQADLTHAEAKTAFAALTAQLGAKATCSIGLNISLWADKATTLKAYFWPDGAGYGGEVIGAEAETYRDLLAKAEAAWSDRADGRAVKTIRKMALAIIEITADRGECTDAALRAEFDAADVARYGERACEQATEMAGLGPFSIVKLSGANDVGEAA